jgi:hypothetical protein
MNADDEETLIACALRGEDRWRTGPAIEFDNADPAWVLFDAARNPSADGDRIETREVTMPVGRVVAETWLAERGPNSAIVHRFRPAGR